MRRGSGSSGRARAERPGLGGAYEGVSWIGKTHGPAVRESPSVPTVTVTAPTSFGMAGARARAPSAR